MKAGVIGITTGDPAGVGPEVIAAALASGKLDSRFTYRVIGEPSVPLCEPGQPTREGTRAALAALEESAQLARNGEILGVVTGPIHKARSQAEGFTFPGQTEFYAERAGVRNFAMLLTGGPLTVALVTAHLSLRDAVDAINGPEILRVGGLLARFLLDRREAGDEKSPRIAVAGLNPHAGEDGAMGREEIGLITPATQELAREWAGSVEFSGAYSPDTVFMRAAAGEFDAVLCMYHDQGLIPLKLLGFDQGVNVTLGLPFVRTSPDHGTAFDIAGKGIARPDSMIAAINLAATMAAARLRRQNGESDGR